MNIKTLSSLLIGVLLTSIAVAAEKSPKKMKVGDIPTATAPSPKKGVKPWEPTAFDQDADRLPPNYPGIDPVRFFKMFKSKVGSVKKGEFETTEEFTQRTTNKDALLSPINTIDTYAFRISGISVKYDADAQAYLIGDQYGFTCQETYSFGEFEGWVTCKVSSISLNNDTYVGSNAYGASLTVERTRGHNFSLAISKGSAFPYTVFTQLRNTGWYSLQDRLPIPLEKARDLKDMKIAVLFVGRITDAKIIEGRGMFSQPKVDSPTDIFITEEAVPFELKRVIYYVIQTGEVLGQRDY